MKKKLQFVSLFALLLRPGCGWQLKVKYLTDILYPLSSAQLSQLSPVSQPLSPSLLPPAGLTLVRSPVCLALLARPSLVERERERETGMAGHNVGTIKSSTILLLLSVSTITYYIERYLNDTAS